MNRTTATFEVNDIDTLKQQMLNWANQFNIFLFLDSCGYADEYSSEEWMLAADVIDEFRPADDVMYELRNWFTQKDDWVFGHVSYDLKNAIEPLHSNHPDNIQFPDVYFFQPAILIRRVGNKVEISSFQSPDEVMRAIDDVQPAAVVNKSTIDIKSRIDREDYLQIIDKLKQHIQRGDCYEINFCQEFFAENAVIDPLQVYQQLTSVSPTPFAGFYKLNDKYLLSASPERYLQKKGCRLVSQPIKGTIKRDLTDPTADEQLKKQLQQSQKDQSENVMVVDLVRNDLSRICEEGSVHVEELYGVYSFPQVHQMISTVAGKLRSECDFIDILKTTFPMGSMTGAPKFKVMQLVEQYEKTKRGIYSGCIGYITPDGDFDFNVVIRSIMYNATDRYLSYQVGGGITFYSDPEKEYEECLLKAEAIKKVL